MKVVIGSENEDKKRVLTQTLSQLWPDLDIRTTNAPSDVVEQPLDEETAILGATNRARNAFLKKPDSNLAVGLEGGLHKIAEKGYFLVCVAAIYDQKRNVYIGISSKLRLPKDVSNKIIKGGFFGQVIREYKKKHRGDNNLKPLIQTLITREKPFSEAIRNAYTCYVNRKHY